jgi:hypothetical protein
MILWNLLDGGPSHKGPLFGPFKSLLGGTSGINPHHKPMMLSILIWLKFD